MLARHRHLWDSPVRAMNLTSVDWVIIFVYLTGCVAAGVSMRRYVGKVEHFIVAGRRMDIYLGVASLAATEMGLVTIMYTAQLGYTRGFAGSLPGILMALAMLVVGMTGFCIKPLREAGVMTIPELFQRRFGAGVHWLAGLVIVLGGVLNMGVFFRLGGEFLVYATGMPEEYLKLVMSFLVLIVLAYTALGGMLSVLITDYLQFLVLGAGLVLVTLLVFVQIGWAGMVGAVQTHYGAAGFNPFVGCDVWWILWQAVQQLAVVLTWQTTVARVLSARDAATAKSIYTRTSFYFVGRFLLPGIWGIGALAVLGSTFAGEGRNSLHAMPTYLGQLVPAGLMGIVIAAMLAAEMSTDSSYLLTWSSVIYNDLVLPLRRRPFLQSTGVRINRVIVCGLAVFLLLYGLWVELPGTAWDYLSITGSIYLSSISVLLISCLYWRRANRYGAYAAICLGALLPLVFLACSVLCRKWSIDLAQAPWLRLFVENPGVSGLASYVGAAAGMALGSQWRPAEEREGTNCV